MLCSLCLAAHCCWRRHYVFGLVMSLVMPRLYYGNATLACLSMSQLRRLQSVPLPDWYIDLLGTSTLHRCYKTFTGCGLWNALTLIWPCSCTDACMLWRHGTFLTTTSSSLIPTAAASSHRHLCSSWSDVHSCLLSAIVCFRFLDATFGTVRHPTSPELHRWLFFWTALKLISFPNHFLHNC